MAVAVGVAVDRGDGQVSADKVALWLGSAVDAAHETKQTAEQEGEHPYDMHTFAGHSGHLPGQQTSVTLSEEESLSNFRAAMRSWLSDCGLKASLR